MRSPFAVGLVSASDGRIPGLPPCRSDCAVNRGAPLCVGRLRDQGRKRVERSIRCKLSADPARPGSTDVVDSLRPRLVQAKSSRSHPASSPPALLLILSSPPLRLRRSRSLTPPAHGRARRRRFRSPRPATSTIHQSYMALS